MLDNLAVHMLVIYETEHFSLCPQVTVDGNQRFHWKCGEKDIYITVDFRISLIITIQETPNLKFGFLNGD